MNSETIHRWALRTGLAAALLAGAPSAHAAGNALDVYDLVADRPTLTALGVRLNIGGDDNKDAWVTVRYRRQGDPSWDAALPLRRVYPEYVSGLSLTPQFGGSIFDLKPNTTYEIEVRAQDGDGSVNVTRTITLKTRPVPRANPAVPVTINVSTAAQFQSALNAAAPGHVIVLANGTYSGQFSMNRSGNADNPIVIRGASRDGVVLDGGNCTGCSVLAANGSYIHIEQLTVRNASRGIRLTTPSSVGNVVRRVRVTNVIDGITGSNDQRDFYICDNVLQGRLTWPHVYSDDTGAHANDDGIVVLGDGHVVCHNDIVGFGDGIKNEAQGGFRSFDVYGNEIRSAYDNGIELDYGISNVRALRNRLTNQYAAISFQPISGGPAYAIRNVIVNVAHEQFKFHGVATTPFQEPSGMYLAHNTIVSPTRAINLPTTAASHYFALRNNLFIGPASPASGITVYWQGPINLGVFKNNSYYPDGQFRMYFHGQGWKTYANFAELQAAGQETNGVLLSSSPFASGLAAPSSYKTTLQPQDVTLSASTPALDKAQLFDNLNTSYAGSGPDIGALERGCTPPVFGVRATGVDESTMAYDCVATTGSAASMDEPEGEGATVHGADGDAPGAASEADTLGGLSSGLAGDASGDVGFACGAATGQGARPAPLLTGALLALGWLAARWRRRHTL